jgi:signal transduction histidine kinase
MRNDTFGRKQLIDTMVQSLYYGGLLSLFLYNLVIFYTNRDRRYLLYCLFTVATGLAMYAGNGFGRLFLWPNYPDFDRISQGFFVGLATGLALLFSCEFLGLRNRTKVIYWTLSCATVVSLTISFIFMLSLIIPMPLGWLFTSQFMISSFGMIVCVCVAIYLSTKGVREAKYFIMSWGFLCVGVIVGTLRAFELVPNNGFTLYAVQISSGFEALFFSFALADRLRSERQDREQAQRQLLASQQETVQALKISEERLANAVNLRTQELRAIVVKEQQVREQYVRFGAMIAHEFRNPLNVIETQNTLLELGAETGVMKVHQRVNVIRSAVDRLSTMFDQWLESDRLNQEFAKVTSLPIDARSLLKDVERSSRSYHCDHFLVCSYSDFPVVIRADYGLLRIAILYLIDNACKYSPKGTQVALGAKLEEGWVGIYVSDQGAGIAPDKLNTIFEPYVRLESEQRLVGVGLGLSFVKRIVDLHNGKIEVTSDVGLGSTFTIWIRLEPLPSSHT